MEFPLSDLVSLRKVGNWTLKDLSLTTLGLSATPLSEGLCLTYRDLSSELKLVVFKRCHRRNEAFLRILVLAHGTDLEKKWLLT